MASTEKANPNMALWDSVKTTDKDHTKTKTLDGREVTSINGMYVVQRATEVFGPLGKGWGYEILVDRFDQGAPITAGKADDPRVIAHEMVHTIQLKLWYLRGGKKNYVTQYGHTPFIRKSQYGPYTDFDAPKKSLTDAIKKCLSLLGFCADVHLGMFEDEVYLQGLELKKRLDEAGEDGATEVMTETKRDFREWFERQLSGMARAPSNSSLDLMKKNLVQQARAKAEVVNYDPNEVERRIEEAAETRKEWLAENPTKPAAPLARANEE